MNCRLRMKRRVRPGQRGFTLIELMIALLISSLMVGLVFSIYTRMSVAYRGQSAVSELQQSLQAAKLQIEQPVRSAGHLIPDGFKVQTGALIPPLVVQNLLSNDVTFPADLIKVYYADASAMAAITAPPPPNFSSVTVDDADNFVIGDLAVIVNPKLTAPLNPGMAQLASYDACVVRVTNIVLPNQIEFGAADPVFNADPNAHCTDALNMAGPGKPMIYRFGSRAYRIDPSAATRSLGILQMSRTGGLIEELTGGGTSDWEAMGVGFTDLQIATRYYDANALDEDGDGDAARDWYSGAVAAPAGAVPLEVSVSLALRTTQEATTVPTSATPDFLVGNANHNRLGDSDAIPLAGVADAARPVQHRGNHIYRYFSMRIDLRNLGVGR